MPLINYLIYQDKFPINIRDPDKAISKNDGTLTSVHGCYKNQEKCNKELIITICVRI